MAYNINIPSLRDSVKDCKTGILVERNSPSRFTIGPGGTTMTDHDFVDLMSRQLEYLIV